MKLFSAKDNLKHYVMVIIGLMITALGWILPPFGMMTVGGMKALFTFIAVIFLWTADEIEWSSIFGIIMVAFMVGELYPDFKGPGVWHAISLSFGAWLITFIVACLIMTYAVTETGMIKRIASWFLRRKVAQKSPWKFTFMLLLSALVIGCFLDPTVTLVFYLGFEKSICELLGYKKGDRYPAMLITATCFTIMIAYCMTPISHVSILMGVGLIGDLTGVYVDFLSYMIVGVPIGIICFLILYLFFMKFYKVDLSNFEGKDLSVVAGEKTPITKREIWSTAIFLIVVAVWLLEGFVNIVAPESALNATLSGITMVIPALVATVVMMIIRVEGRPLLDFNTAMRKGVPWNVIALLACVFVIGSVITVDTAGFTATIASWLLPIMGSGMNTFVIMAIIGVLMVVATNFLNNIPIMMLALNVLMPLAVGMGLKGGAAGMAIMIAVNLAFATPASFANNAIVFADDWAIRKECYKFGFIAMGISMVVCGLILFPWANLVLPT